MSDDVLPSDPLNLFFLLAPFPYDWKRNKKKEIIVRLSHRYPGLVLENAKDQKQGMNRRQVGIIKRLLLEKSQLRISKQWVYEEENFLDKALKDLIKSI